MICYDRIEYVALSQITPVPYILHYEDIASAKMTPVLREAMLFLFEPA